MRRNILKLYPQICEKIKEHDEEKMFSPKLKFVSDKNQLSDILGFVRYIREFAR
ncbi:MAG: hypothetical protein PHV68_00455 [Candidatus Gastranaerophilales bacterium]|nr:hypothetical protein [Candidatus Gastranaerophilales bacterium]